MPNPLAPKKNALWDRSALGLDKPLDMQGRATFLPIQTTNYPSLGNWQWALPGALASMVNAVTFPSRAVEQAAAGTPYSREQMAQEGLNTAMNTSLDSYALSRGMKNALPPTEEPSIDIGAQVYHGSPHQFDQFDSSKIGTGEGAQAYGHGLYFAESPEVAGQYSKNLGTSIAVDGRPMYQAGQYKGTGLGTEEDSLLLHTHGDIDKAITQAKFEITDPGRLKNVIGNLESARGKVTTASTGSIYHAEIPDSAISQMLDWDKPLSEQPAMIRKGIDRALKEAGAPSDFAAADFKTGRDAYNFLARHMPARSTNAGPNTALEGDAAMMTSEALRAAGIPGIRYLDAGSRGAAEGTRNIVLFDDKLAKIVKRE